MNGLREFLNTPKGRVVGIVLALIAVGAVIYTLSTSLGSDPAASDSTRRVFICAETGRTFSHTIRAGELSPVLSPHSGKNTGFEPEQCFWTADGQVKSEPTYVLLDGITEGNPRATKCPDCGRRVVPLNPPAMAGGTPPPMFGQRSDADER